MYEYKVSKDNLRCCPNPVSLAKSAALLISCFSISRHIFQPIYVDARKGAILYLLLIPLIIIAAFRYAFVPYLIIEDKKQGFLERFQTSRKLTEGIYGKIFLAGVIAVVLGIAVGIITSLLSTPFQNKAVTNNSYTSNQIKFGEIENERDFRRALKQNTENALTSGNIIATIIQETGSAAMGIIVLGAMLELYRRRKEDLNI